MNQYREGDEPVPGTGYHLVKFLGRGGFGEVWKAIAPGGAEVAIKFIRLGGAEGRKEFRALQLVKRVRHPNLMPLNAFWLKDADGSVLDHAESELAEEAAFHTACDQLKQTLVAPRAPTGPAAAELIIAMGLGDQSLFDRLQECRAQGLDGIPRDELLGYMEDAARAIDFLNSPTHALGSGLKAIQHCDIKPHNIMTVGGAVQVCDFGLARMLGADRKTSAAATIAYAAPECLDPGEPSASTDQYSLAISYYEMRTGKLPYADETIAAVLRAKKDGDLDFSGVPIEEQAVLCRATMPNPADRFPTSLAMVKALRQAPQEDARTTTVLRAKRRRPVRAVVFGLAALAMLVAAGLTVWRGLPGGQDQPKNKQDQPKDKNVKSAIAVASADEEHLNKAKSSSPEKRTDELPGNAKEEATLSPPPKPSAEDLLARGTTLLDQQKYDEAVTAFTAAIDAAPRDARVFSRRGVARFLQGRFQDAADDFGMAIKLEPDARDHVNRGRAYLGMERAADALTDFDEAVRLDPRNAAALFHRGIVHQGMKQYQLAITDLSEAIKLVGGDKPVEQAIALGAGFPLPAAFERRGLCRLLLEQPDPDGAEQDFTTALHLEPEDPAELHEFRATAFELNNQPEPAKYDTQLAGLYKRLKQAPDDANTLCELAELLATCAESQLRDAKGAKAASTRACELTQWKDARCLAALADAEAAAGNPAEAAKRMQEAVGLETDPVKNAAYRARLEKKP